MTKYEFLTLLISLLAVVVSAVSLFRTRRIAEQQLELDKITAKLSSKQLEKIEAEEHSLSVANVDVDLIKHGDIYRFLLTNTGGSEASNVYFSLEACNKNPLVVNEFKEKVPFKVIKPNKSVYLTAALTMGSDHEYTSNVRWTNPNGEQESAQHVHTW